jgi:hypothetical protein
MSTKSSARTAPASPAAVLRLAASTVTTEVADWGVDRVLAAPATFGKAVLGDLTDRRKARRLPAQAMRDATKAAGVYARTPCPTTQAPWLQAQARTAEAMAWFAGAVDLLAAIPNPHGVTIGRIPGVAADRALTVRDLIDGLTLPPSKSEVAAWLAGAE